MTAGLRILWVKPGGLWPPHTGGRLRSFHMIAELARRHRLVVATTHRPAEDAAATARALPACERVVCVEHEPARLGTPRSAAALLAAWRAGLPVDVVRWRVPALRRVVAEVLAAAPVDLVVADFLVGLGNVPPTPAPLVLFEHNVEHVIWERLAAVEPRAWRRQLLAGEARRVRRYETAACGRAALTVAVSEADRARLAALVPGARIGAVPTGVDTRYFAPDGWRETAESVVFSGSMDWYPNEDAALHFLDAILPRIRRAVPGAAFTIAGRNPGARLRAAAACARARVTGTVDDIRSYLGPAAVCVVPLRIGGGTRLKIFEALALGKAVVATAVGAEGLPLVPGRHFVRADDPADFAAAVVSLLRDPDRRRALGREGRRLVEVRYGWPAVARAFEGLCETALEVAA